MFRNGVFHKEDLRIGLPWWILLFGLFNIWYYLQRELSGLEILQEGEKGKRAKTERRSGSVRSVC